MYGCSRSVDVPNSTASTCSQVSAFDLRPGSPTGTSASSTAIGALLHPQHPGFAGARRTLGLPGSAARDGDP